MYPKGNKNEQGAGQVSLYLQIDNTTLLNSPKEVYAEVKFFIDNQKQDKYLTYQGTSVRSVVSLVAITILSKNYSYKKKKLYLQKGISNSIF